MMKRAVWFFLITLCLCAGWAQTNPNGYLLDWTAKTKTSQSLIQWLHVRLDRLVNAVVRYTSPDIPRESRRLWRISVDGQNKCLLTSDTGVHLPRWGNSGYILFLLEADTNGDHKIDALDDYLIRIVPEDGGAARTVGQGKSAVWSPDGKYIAFLRDGRLQVVNLAGEPVVGREIPAGQIVMTNSLNPEVARSFWAVDTQTGSNTSLPADLEKKYLWLGMLSPSGSKVAYSNTTKKNLVIVETGQTAGTSLAAGDALNFDPAWSPDEKRIVYVSTSRRGNPCSAP